MRKILSLFAAEGIAPCSVCWGVFIHCYKPVFLRDKAAPWEEQLFKEREVEWIGQLKGTADEHGSSRGAAALLAQLQRATLHGSLLNVCLSLLTSAALGFGIKTENTLHYIVLL